MDRFVIRSSKKSAQIEIAVIASDAVVDSESPQNETAVIANDAVLHVLDRLDSEPEQSDSQPESGQDDTDPDPESSQKRRRKYTPITPNHRPEWERKFTWLKYNVNMKKTICTVCNKTITSNLSHIKRHELTTSHTNNMKKALNTPVLETFGLTKQSSMENQTKSAELKLIMFLHEHNLPFNLMEHMVQLLKSIAPDTEIIKHIKCSRTKATELTKVIADEEMDILKKKLQNKLYSIVIDETTDLSTQKSLAVLVRYYDNELQEVRDSFLGLIRLYSCNAESLTNAVTNLLNMNNIDINNMIGFAADNAAVMMGNKLGVQAKLKGFNPTLCVIGCTCHSMHLCASYASHNLPKSVEEFCRNVFNHFSNSSQRNEGLQEFQQFLNIKTVKMLHPSQTRWMSLQAVVDRILQSWDALKLYFTGVTLEDNLRNTQNILDSLNTPIVKAYLLFLSYILGIVNKINLEFQSSSPKIYQLLSKVKGLFRTILRNFIKINVLNEVDISEISVSDPHNFLPLEEMYFGAKVENLISETEIHKFKTNVLAFYVQLALQIKKRFQFDDPLLNFVSVFEPETATTGKISSILNIIKFIPQIPISDVEDLNTEWRLLSDIEVVREKAKSTNFLEFWSFIFELKNEMNELLFPNVTAVVKTVIILPHSSACAERIFSQLTLLKTKQRNRLLIETCDNILHAKELLKPSTCYQWEPSQSLLRRKVNYNVDRNQ